MTTKLPFLIIPLFSLLFFSCSSVKVLDAWTGPEENVEKFKQKNVLILARTSNTTARIAFEEEIAKALSAEGIQVTESFKKFPKIHMEREMTEEREAMVSSILESEGYTGIVITAVRDKEQTTSTQTSGVYVGTSYGYPGYYSGFYDYYRYPYAYGPYYNSFGGYIPTGSTTTTYTTYILETVAYNLDEPEENQLVFVTRTSLDDPENAYKTAKKYVEKIAEKLGE